MNHTQETTKADTASPGLSWSEYLEEQFIGNDRTTITTPCLLEKLMPALFRRTETPHSLNQSVSRDLFPAWNAEPVDRTAQGRQPLSGTGWPFRYRGLLVRMVQVIGTL